MYAAGQPHPLKGPSAQVLALVADQPETFVTSAEVLQELLYRYLAQHRWTYGRVVFHEFAILMRGRVESIDAADVEQAAWLAAQHPRLSARDLIHLAIMARVGADWIVSADRGFDTVPRVERLDPADVHAWRQRVET